MTKKINAFGEGTSLPQPDVWEGAFDEVFFVIVSGPVRYQLLIGPTTMPHVLLGPSTVLYVLAD